MCWGIPGGGAGGGRGIPAARILLVRLMAWLMVVRSQSTPFDVARKARMGFPDQSLVGVVLNGTREGAPYERYYYEEYHKKVTAKV